MIPPPLVPAGKGKASAASYPVPARQVRTEISVVNSRFIATLGPAFTVAEAKDLIQQVRREFPDASHHVPAYLIGYGSSVTAHCSDAGEPAGTAGRPALAVLQGSGLGDAALVITRYFGGTKLGTGGLVHAYGEAARQVIAQAPRARKMLTQLVMLGLPYRLLEQARLLVAAHSGKILDESFAAEITQTLRFPVEKLPGFQAAISELSNGSLQAELIETAAVLVPDDAPGSP
jgi:uncharacterized YigZ family protein